MPKRLTLGRLALVGDAAEVGVPATRAGFFTGLEEVESLSQAMEAEDAGEGPRSKHTGGSGSVGPDGWVKAAAIGAVAIYVDGIRQQPSEGGFCPLAGACALASVVTRRDRLQAAA